MCEIDYENNVELWKWSAPRARKPHRCDCCSATINAGELYARVFYIMDGDAHHEKFCPACKEISDEFAKEHGGFRWAPNGFQEALEDCAGDDKWLKYAEDISTRRLTVSK